MATNLTITNAAISAGWSMTNDDGFGGTTNNANNLTWQLTSPLTDGAGAGLANRLYVVSTTIAGAGTLNLDLAASLTDFFGNSITFARVKGMIIQHLSTTTASSIQVGNGAQPMLNWVGAAAHTINIPNGYTFALLGGDATGFPVTATTADDLLITNNDATNTATIKVMIYGAAT